MKKKLFAVVVLTVFCISMLVGCNVFTKNQERDYFQTVATVSYNDMSVDIYKGELLSYYAQNAYTYQYYYQWSAEKILDEFMKILAKKELIVLKARQHFSDKLGIKKDADLESFLRPDEIQYVRETTNKQFQESLDEEIKKIVKEREQNAGKKEDDEKTEETNKDIENARPKKAEDDTVAEYEKDDSFTQEQIQKKFEESAAGFTDADEKEAWDRLVSTLKKQYKDFNYFYDANLKQRFIEKYKDDVNSSITVTDEEINERYTIIYEQNLANYIDDASYKAAVDAGTKGNFVFYHKKQGYATVKSILLEFNEEQTKLLDIEKAKYPNNTTHDKEAYRAARKQIAIGTGGYEIGIKVDVSNPNYDSGKACTVKECSTSNPVCTLDSNAACPNRVFDRKGVSYETILSEISADVEAAVAAATTPSDKQKARLDTFEKWIYLVNNDPGMFEGKNYTITPKGVDSEFVEEFTDLGRALAAGSVGDMKVADISAMDQNVFGTIDGITYIINDFGIHMMMIQYINIDGDADKYEEVFKKGTTEVIGYRLKLDYIYESDTQKTVKDVISAKLLEEKGTIAYSKHERAFFSQYEEGSVIRNKSVYNKLLAEIKKELSSLS